MRIVFIGFAIEPDKCYEKKGASVAGNNMQLGVLEGLYKHSNNNTQVITIYPIAAFPKEKKILLNKSYAYLGKEKIKSSIINFVNLPIIKIISQSISLYIELNNIMKKEKKNEEILLFCFNAVPNISMVVIEIARKFNTRSVCMLADPPVDNIRRNWFRTLFRRFRDRVSAWTIRKFDKLVVLNENAAKEFGPLLPHIVIDCGIDIQDKDLAPLIETSLVEKDKILVFTGVLQDHSGVANLIKAMEYIEDKSVVLHIYGKGPLQEEIEMIANTTENIKYKGFVTHEEIKKIQSEAYILINPSDSKHPINKVAFPSKLMEYMISGTPVISTRLDCISAEYEDKLFFFREDNPLAMADTIKELLNLNSEEYRIITNKAKSFILNNKTWFNQTRKIYEFIKN